eukprot:TRINITY_DN5012_c0_g9_i2.p1 TRINITY_DN5012_c0_g9~~TRINITY_DN5012_c0_g9_i2.p1  ORF type:complete len:121 (+),score=49.16 TRINITY_DN5012_c0_g9_i2:118-480(+)
MGDGSVGGDGDDGDMGDGCVGGDGDDEGGSGGAGDDGGDGGGDDGVYYTGFLKGGAFIRDQKGKRVTELLNEAKNRNNNLKIKVYGYGNSKNDIPFLLLANEEACMVNPSTGVLTKFKQG